MHQVNLHHHDTLVKRASYASVATAVVLIIAKTFAYYETHSVGVLGALVDSITDAAASLINMFAIAYAIRPADDDHRFGHGKMESLAGLGQSLFIVLSAIYLAITSIDRLVNPVALEKMEWGIGIALFSLIMTIALLLYQRSIVKTTHSQAVKADALHYFSDVLANLTLLISFLCYGFGWWWMDPLVGFGVAIYIMKSAYEIGEESFQGLLDQEISDDLRKDITDLALKYPHTKGVHALKTRQSGRNQFIQFHLEIDGELSLKEAHGIADKIEKEIEQKYPRSEVIIHQDPY